MKAFFNIKLAKKLTLKGKQATVTAIIYHRGREGERKKIWMRGSGNKRKGESEWERKHWGQGEGHKRERWKGEGGRGTEREMGQGGGKEYTFILFPLFQETKGICLET